MTIVFDADCPFCIRCGDWLVAQRPAIALSVVPSSDPGVIGAYGRLPGFGEELLVIADTGQLWVGPDAFLAAMWCLDRYRHLALGLSGPAAHGMARAFFQKVSAKRGRIGSAMGLECEDGRCDTPVGG